MVSVERNRVPFRLQIEMQIFVRPFIKQGTLTKAFFGRFLFLQHVWDCEESVNLKNGFEINVRFLVGASIPVNNYIYEPVEFYLLAAGSAKFHELLKVTQMLS